MIKKQRQMRNQPLPGLQKCKKCGRLKAQCGCNYASPLKHEMFPPRVHGHEMSDVIKENREKQKKKKNK